MRFIMMIIPFLKKLDFAVICILTTALCSTCRTDFLYYGNYGNPRISGMRGCCRKTLEKLDIAVSIDFVYALRLPSVKSVPLGVGLRAF
jgi:hypothetical protein